MVSEKTVDFVLMTVFGGLAGIGITIGIFYGANRLYHLIVRADNWLDPFPLPKHDPTRKHW